MERNKDGSYHLQDLRRWEEQTDEVSVFNQGHDWIVSQYNSHIRANMLHRMPLGSNERYAIEYAYCLRRFDH